MQWERLEQKWRCVTTHRSSGIHIPAVGQSGEDMSHNLEWVIPSHSLLEQVEKVLIWCLNTTGTQIMAAVVNINGRVRSRTQARFLIKYLTHFLDRPGQ